MANGSENKEFKPSRQIVVTDQMVEAGIDRLNDLLTAGVGSAYVVSEVFQAMSACMECYGPQPQAHQAQGDA